MQISSSPIEFLVYHDTGRQHSKISLLELLILVRSTNMIFLYYPDLRDREFELHSLRQSISCENVQRFHLNEFSRMRNSSTDLINFAWKCNVVLTQYAWDSFYPSKRFAHMLNQVSVVTREQNPKLVTTISFTRKKKCLFISPRLCRYLQRISLATIIFAEIITFSHRFKKKTLVKFNLRKERIRIRFAPA